MGNDISMKISVTDHSKEALEEMEEQVGRALEAIGLQAEGYAKLLCPVDTGLLRNSITYAVAGDYPAQRDYKSNSSHASTPATQRAGTAGKAIKIKKGKYTKKASKEDKMAVYIGSNVEYAAFVELGTRRTKAQPYIKPAVMDHGGEYKKIVKEFLKG